MVDYTPKARKSPSLKPVLGAVGASFLLGGAAAATGFYFYDQYSGDAPTVGEAAEAALAAGEEAASPEALADASEAADPEAAQEVAQEAAQEAAEEVVERVEEQQGGLDQRLAAAEQRLARLDLQAQAASGNAARAEGLLIAFAARRSLERGAQLGFLADQLRLRFGDAQPNAVRTIIEFSRNPVTMDELVAQLDGLAPQLAEPEQDWSWDTLRSELSDLFVVRRESTPSPQPERRLERAKLFLQSGRVSPAVEEVRGLPGAQNASGWIALAERFASAQQALDLLETTAVLEPRRLRDGEGAIVEQPSPAQLGPNESTSESNSAAQ
jgi:hypothetical protein